MTEPVPVAALVAWPLFAAVLLALLPARLGDRPLGFAAFLAAVSTAVLAAIAVATPAPPGPLWLVDRLAGSLTCLLTLPWLLVSAWALLSGLAAAPGWRRWPFAAQLGTAGAILACRANPLFLMLIGFAVLLAGAALLQGRPRHRAVLFAAILLTSWLGAASLSAGLGQPASWTMLGLRFAAIPPMLGTLGMLLLVLPMLLLGWSGSAGQDMAGPGRNDHAPADLLGRCIAGALLPLLLGIPALGATLRLRGLPQQGLDMLVLTAGVLGLVLAVGLMPGRRGLGERLSLAAAVQLAGAAIGLGIGGTGAVSALMTLLFLSLTLPVAVLPATPRAGSTVRRLAVLALAGMPPFGPFTAGFVLLLRLFAAAPLPALLVLGAFLATALFLLSALRDPLPAAGPAGRLAALPGLAVLACLGWLGLAMPEDASGWLLGLVDAAPGTAPSP